MSIIICLVWSNIAIDDVMLSLGGYVLYTFVDFVFVWALLFRTLLH